MDVHLFDLTFLCIGLCTDFCIMPKSTPSKKRSLAFWNLHLMEMVECCFSLSWVLIVHHTKEHWSFNNGVACMTLRGWVSVHFAHQKPPCEYIKWGWGRRSMNFLFVLVHVDYNVLKVSFQNDKWPRAWSFQENEYKDGTYISLRSILWCFFMTYKCSLVDTHKTSLFSNFQSIWLCLRVMLDPYCCA